MSTGFRNLVQKAFSPKYLVYTNTTLGCTFYTAADAIEQKLNKYVMKSNAAFDTERSKAMAGGGLFFGALGHYWYTFLDKKFPGTAKRTMVKKIIAETVIGPPFAVTIFMIVGSLEGKALSRCWNDFIDNIVLLCVADWGFYVPLQYLNFYYLPPKYRFLFVAAITLVYDTVIAHLLHRPSPSGQQNLVSSDPKKAEPQSG